MKLTCLRHGLTPLNAAHRFNGTIQEGITLEQRATLDTVLFDDSGFDVVYSSHLLRCIETAEALKIKQWVVDQRLAERSLGVFEGLTASECNDRYPDAWASFLRLDADFRIPGGESRAEHLDRVMEWLKEAAQHAAVLAITHGGTIDFLYRLGTNRPLHGGTDIFGGENASLTTFTVKWPEVSLESYSAALTSAAA